MVSTQLWDTAGGEKHLSFQSIFYRKADGCLLVFDLTNPESFNSVPVWKEELLTKGEVPNPRDFPIVLVGNKVDLESERKVLLIDNA